MRDFLLQIVLFLIGALVGVVAQLIPTSGQRWLSAGLSLILISTAAFWAGYELGVRQATTQVLVAPTPSTTETPLSSETLIYDAVKTGSWPSSCVQKDANGVLLQRVSSNDTDRECYHNEFNKELNDFTITWSITAEGRAAILSTCLLYTSDAADE